MGCGMLLRKFNEHIRMQDWFAHVLDIETKLVDVQQLLRSRITRLKK
jgi:hypothetical protein